MAHMIICSTVLVALLFAGSVSAGGSPSKPNIMFILADDLGYNEVNFMNSTRGIMTPNLDTLAHAGVILKNYYVQPICSPTRSALMTGRYTIRLGTQSNVIYWDTPWGISLNETFMSDNLKDAGYFTGMFGKWHLGMFTPDYEPINRGFQEHMGYFQGCESSWTHVSACCSAGSPDTDENYVCKPGAWKNKTDYRGYDWFKSGPMPNNGTSNPDYTANHSKSTYLIRDAAIDFLKRATKSPKPFFLYLPFQNIHGPYTTDVVYRKPYEAHPDKFTEGEMTMFGYISEMDDAVGHIISELNASGARDNTYIIFSSDNGAPPAGEDVDHKRGQNPGWIARNYPFRGFKTLIWEGGTRVAGFISSPLLPKSAQGTVSEKLFHVTDWLPTITTMAGASTKKNLPTDGHDIFAALTTSAPSPRTEMLYNVNPLCNDGQAGAPKAGLRMGNYKVLAWCYNIKGVDGANETGPVAGPNEFADGPILYDLEADPTESTNIAKQNPDQLKKMLSRLEQLALESVIPMQWTPPYQGEDYFCAHCPTRPPVDDPAKPWSPWLK